MSMRECAEADEAVDLGLLIAVRRWCDIEMQPVLRSRRRRQLAAPGDLRAAVRRANRGLLVLVPHQRPAQRFAPEIPDLLRAVARDRADEAAVGEELVARLDHAELVAFRIGEHHMTFFGPLTDVDVAAAQCQRAVDRLLLIIERRAGQVEMHVVLARLGLIGRAESQLEPGVIVRYEGRAFGAAPVVIVQPKRPPQKRARPAGSIASNVRRHEFAAHW